MFVGKTNDDDELFTKKIVFNKVPFSHIKHEVKTTSKCTKFISERAYA